MFVLLEAFKIEGKRSKDEFHFCRVAASFNQKLKRTKYAVIFFAKIRKKTAIKFSRLAKR